MKIEQLKRKIDKIDEKLEIVLENRMVPYQDFMEGKGKYSGVLRGLKDVLKARLMNDLVKLSLFGNLDVDDEECDKYLEMMQSAAPKDSDDETYGIPLDYEPENEDETSNKPLSTNTTGKLISNIKDIRKTRNKVEIIKGNPTHLLFPKNISKYYGSSNEEDKASNSKSRLSIYYVTPIYADGSRGDPNLYPVLDL